MYDYEEISYPKVNDKVKFNRHFNFVSVLYKYQSNISINKSLEKRLFNDKINAEEYSQLNEILDACVFHLNQTLEFNKKNNGNLNHHYIIKYSPSIFGATIGYEIIDEKRFEKCNLFNK